MLQVHNIDIIAHTLKYKNNISLKVDVIPSTLLADLTSKANGNYWYFLIP